SPKSRIPAILAEHPVTERQKSSSALRRDFSFSCLGFRKTVTSVTGSRKTAWSIDEIGIPACDRFCRFGDIRSHFGDTSVTGAPGTEGDR
ncbi:hypothetical protein, partial [Microbacterium lacticum]|uniref:hypothetical protein n=1 Tax=Microbacterium lacticum TaxID=33885 RepID=UPI001E643974